MSDDLDPLDREAWDPLLAFLEEVEAERAADAVEGWDADADLDGWLAAMWAGVEPAHVAAGPAWCVGGPGADRPSRRPAALGRALPPRPAAAGRPRGGT
jgi:hypothetical protein